MLEFRSDHRLEVVRLLFQLRVTKNKAGQRVGARLQRLQPVYHSDMIREHHPEIFDTLIRDSV